MPPSNPTEAVICEWCATHIAEILGIPAEKISPDISFARLGLDSARSLYLVLELEEWLGVELGPEVIFDHPSIAALARHLSARCGGRNGGGGDGAS